MASQAMFCVEDLPCQFLIPNALQMQIQKRPRRRRGRAKPHRRPGQTKVIHFSK